MSSFDLKGRVALVTGGNGGIGLGMARGLAQAGAAIAVAGRNQEKSEAAAAELSAKGVKTAVVEVDVTDEMSCRKMVDTTMAQLGRLDILINNAGINIRKQPQDYTLAEWRLVIESNLSSAFTCSHAAYPHMKSAGGGKIINIGSMMSIFGASFAPAYAASKGGIVQLKSSPCHGLGQGQHPGQRRASGLDRHRPHQAGPRGSIRVEQHGADAHAGATLGYARRHERHCRLSCEPGLRLRDRNGHSGGWRLCRTGLSYASPTPHD